MTAEVAPNVQPVTPMSSKRAVDAEADSPATTAKKAKPGEEDAVSAFDPTFGASKPTEAATQDPKTDKAPSDVGPQADADEEEEDDVVGNVLEELVEMFTQKNGRAPTEDEIAMWVDQIKGANVMGGTDDDEEDEEEEEDEEDNSEEEGDQEDESEDGDDA